MSHERRQYAGAAPATTLNGAINNSVTSITLTDGTGYPDGSVGPFFIIVDRGLSTEEKIKCLSRSGNTIVATGGRNADGTSAFAHANAAPVEHVFTATDADEANSHYASASLDHHTQYSRTDGTRAFTGVTAIAGTPGASAVGDSAAAGTATTLVRSDHRHGREAFAAPGSSAPGDAAAAGSATTVSRSDHVHGREGPGDLLAVVVYRAGSEAAYTSSSTSYVDADATNLAITFTAPSSGKVLVRQEGTAYADSGGSAYWNLREAAADVANTNAQVISNQNADLNPDQVRCSNSSLITGLTPGSSHTYKWGIKSGNISFIMYLSRGPNHPLHMSVWAVP